MLRVPQNLRAAAPGRVAGDHKKIERLYREEGLPLRRWARKKLTAVPRVALPLTREPGRCSRWTLSMAGWPLADGSSA